MFRFNGRVSKAKKCIEKQLNLRTRHILYLFLKILYSTFSIDSSEPFIYLFIFLHFLDHVRTETDKGAPYFTKPIISASNSTKFFHSSSSSHKKTLQATFLIQVSTLMQSWYLCVQPLIVYTNTHTIKKCIVVLENLV